MECKFKNISKVVYLVPQLSPNYIHIEHITELLSFNKLKPDEH